MTTTHGHGAGTSTASGENGANWVAWIRGILVISVITLVIIGAISKCQRSHPEKTDAVKTATNNPVSDFTGITDITAVCGSLPLGNYRLLINGETTFAPNGVVINFGYSPSGITFIQNDKEFVYKGRNFTGDIPDLSAPMTVKGENDVLPLTVVKTDL